MGGGYIACGSFLGADKSGSAFRGLLEGIAGFLPSEEGERFRATVANPILERGCSQTQTLTIPSELVSQLEGPLRQYMDYLGELLGYPVPHEAPDLYRKAGLNPTEAKWGKGCGWQYYCADDLLQACEESRRTGEPIVLSFD
jgi:hypothetical protein